MLKMDKGVQGGRNTIKQGRLKVKAIAGKPKKKRAT
jgi:hypothetical protein